MSFKTKPRSFSKTSKKEKPLSVLKVVIISSVILGLTVAYYRSYRIPQVIKTTEKETIAKYNGNSYAVYIANGDMAQGSTLSKGQFLRVERPQGFVPNSAIVSDSDIANKVPRINLVKNMIITADMLVAPSNFITADTKRQSFRQIKLTPLAKKGQFIDVRIHRIDGSEDTVLSKKQIIDSSGADLFLNLTEKERGLLSAATVECLIKLPQAPDNLGYLYTVVYIDAENQPAAQVTYKADPRIINLINENPGLLTKAVDSLVSSNGNSSTQQNSNIQQSNSTPQNNTAK